MKTFQFFAQNHGLTPQKNSIFGTWKMIIFMIEKSFVFFQNIIQHYFYPYLKPKLDKEKLKC